MTSLWRQLAAACTTVVALCASAATASAQVAVTDPIGGVLLDRAGTVMNVAAGIPPLPSGISATGWLVADLDNGDVLAARAAHTRFAPASTLKTLTAVALMPALDREQVVYVTADDVRVEGSKVGVVAGQPYTVDTLFTAMLVVSGNDAANALAGAAGGMPRAVALMNQAARRLQAGDTVAHNTSGLDAPGQSSSPYDLALITREGMRSADYRRYVGTLRSWIDAPGGKQFEIYNHNKLLTRYPGTTGGKTGYTIAARHTYVVTAQRGGRTLVVTLMRAETDYQDATKLLDWGFAAAGRVTPVGELVDPIPEVRPDVRADRSRVLAAPAQATPVDTSSPGLPVLPIAGGVATVGAGGLFLRRAQVKRRRAPHLPLSSLVS